MKKVLFFISLLIAFNSNAQWEWQNPLPQGNSLVSVHFVDSMEGWTVGDYGTVMHTLDGGVNWDILSIGTTEELNDVYFADHNYGWIVGYGLIYHTSDGGVTWIEQDMPVPLNCEAVFFINESEGWVVGSNYVILHTADGGTFWEEQDSGMGTEYGWLMSVFFIDENLGWTCGWSNVLLKTTDGGESWIDISPAGNGILSSVFFIDNSIGWATGSGSVLKSTNGGNGWTIVASDLQGTGSIYFSDLQNGWMCGGYGIISQTFDGGFTWELMNTGTAISLYNMHIPAQGTGYAVGGFGKILSYNEDIDAWEALTDGYFNKWSELFFIDENEGWAAGLGFHHTTDGGKNWDEQVIDTGIYVSAVHFEDNMNGWAAGHRQIYRTRDGGDSWSLQLDLGKSYDTTLSRLFFTDTLHGWALDYYGLLFHTNNGGNTWQEQFSGITDIQQNAIFAIDSMTAWISGGYGWISKTTNGGENWSAYSTGFEFSMGWDIQFTDADHGWIIDDYGILYSEDGGLNWTRISNEGGGAIHFINPLQGWQARWSGISRTTDGGFSWETQNKLTNSYIYDVWFVNEFTGWAVGSLGITLYTNNGGTVGTPEPEFQISNFNVNCFPNPAIFSTTIEYMLDYPAFVTLDIYNINGQLVECLVNSHQNIGTYQINWEAGHMPAGVYFYKLNLGELSTSGRLILIR